MTLTFNCLEVTSAKSKDQIIDVKYLGNRYRYRGLVPIQRTTNRKWHMDYRMVT